MPILLVSCDQLAMPRLLLYHLLIMSCIADIATRPKPVQTENLFRETHGPPGGGGTLGSRKGSGPEDRDIIVIEVLKPYKMERIEV